MQNRKRAILSEFVTGDGVKLTGHKAQVYQWVQRWPGITTAEIARQTQTAVSHCRQVTVSLANRGLISSTMEAGAKRWHTGGSASFTAHINGPWLKEIPPQITGATF